VVQFWWQSGSSFGSGSPKSEIRILRIGGGLCSLSISFLVLLCIVSELLPVALTPDDIERNPEFGKLLKALTQHILPTGAFASSEEDVQEVSASSLHFYCTVLASMLYAVVMCLSVHLSVHHKSVLN